MDPFDVTTITKIGEILNNPERPLKERFRALFTLRNIGGLLARKFICDCFNDESALLKHELAYCLGQMQDLCAIPKLIEVLQDLNENSMVRHEAAEALGAIGCESTLEILKKYSTDNIQEVAETCQLATYRIVYVNNHILPKSQFNSVDPAPPSTDKNINVLKSFLLNNDNSLIERYQAMFALRNLQNDDSCLALCEGLFTGSPLFRHEIAFVLGQLQNTISVGYLIQCLKDVKQHEMVRHECAEALGSIATPECMEILKDYLNDSSRVVRESCEIALDMADYENSFQFQYANTLSIIK